MATKIKSPYTLFSETDKSQTYTSPNISDFVVIGRTPKGRFYVPTVVTNYAQYKKYFGGATRDEYTGLTVKETLIDADSITVVSIGGTEDYTVDPVFDLQMTSGSVTRTIAQLYLSKEGIAQGVTSASVSGSVDSNGFNIQFYSGSTELTDYEAVSMSLYSNDTDKWVGNYTNPLADNQLFYTKYHISMTDAQKENSGSLGGAVATSDPVSLVASSSDVTFSGYDEGETPWIVSQEINSSNYKLFKFETLGHGDTANRDVKISIVNVREPSDLSDPDATFGLFDVLVRAYNDEDDEEEVLESFNNVTLDPESPNYIGRRIGDLKREYNTNSEQVEESGVYENSSEFVRVVLDLSDKPDSAVPFGFESYKQPTTFFDGIVPAFVKYPNSGSGNYSGVDFELDYVDTLHSELPKSSSDFFNTGSAGATFTLTSSVSALPLEDRKFSVGFQGATAGINAATKSNVGLSASVNNTFGMDFTDTSSDGYLAYKKAIDIVSDKEIIRFKTLSLAGLTLKQHGNVYNYAHDMAKKNTRGEIIVLSDPTEPNSNAKTNVADIETTTNGAFDSSFAATFAPWYWYNDGELGKVLAPQGALMPRTLAYNDKVSAPWYGAFGYERGIQGGARPYTRYNINLRDRLHDARVNSIVSFVGEPTPLVMNNKTLQRKDTALSFLNVRRLLNEAKIEFDFITRRYYGRPYTAATRNELSEEINQYLTSVQNDNGLETFEAIFDDSVNTQEYQSQAIIRGVVFLVPIKSVQGIEIGFVIGESGTTFEENQ